MKYIYIVCSTTSTAEQQTRLVRCWMVTRGHRSGYSDVLSSGNNRSAPVESRKWPDICHSKWNPQLHFQPVQSIYHKFNTV